VTVLAEHKAKEDAHAKAQDALRGPLNARQEGSNDSDQDPKHHPRFALIN